jgi:putative PIN family toxin of toxin-antitoxin system
MRIVIDTNIWVSGLLWRGLPWNLLRLAETKQVEICVAPPMLAELERVLSYSRLQARWIKLGLELTDLMTYVLNLSTIFEVAPPKSDVPLVPADPDDDIFLRCAITAEAVYIVSGDDHLLNLEHYQTISIVNIRDFLSEEFPDFLPPNTNP